MNAIAERFEIAEYSATAAAIAELKATYGGVVYDCKTAAGMDAAVRARKDSGVSGA